MGVMHFIHHVVTMYLLTSSTNSLALEEEALLLELIIMDILHFIMYDINTINKLIDIGGKDLVMTTNNDGDTTLHDACKKHLILCLPVHTSCDHL
jgi:hypothetical protein